MGVVNITPDSFSDAGVFSDSNCAAERCLELAGKGADIVDLGGASSRPGAEPVSAEEEAQRVLPVLQKVRQHLSIPISVDTTKSEVAQAALTEGADIINDISAFRFDLEMPRVVSQWRAGVVLMHMRGNPRTMQELPPSRDILEEIGTDLQLAISKGLGEGIPNDRIIIDPGIGFGKTFEDNCRILNRLSFLDRFQLPVLVGTSRKTFLGKILDRPVSERIWGTAASVALAIIRGAHLVRVHDVEEMSQVARVTDAVMAEQMLE